MSLIVNYQEQGEVKAKFPATDIRYRGVFDNDITITVDTITVDTVTVDPITSMDVGTSYSGEVAGSLFDTIEKIEQDIGASNVYVPDEDLSLADLMGIMEENDSANNLELGVAEVVVDASSVTDESSEVKCESKEGADIESADYPDLKCEASAVNTVDSCLPEINEVGDGVITITDSMDEVKGADAPSDGCELESGASEGAKVSKVEDGATIVPIQTIPKDRLREIFKYANGT